MVDSILKNLALVAPSSPFASHGVRQLWAIADQNLVFVAWSRGGVYFRVRRIDLAIPLVEIAGLRMDKRDFVLEPEQGPFAPVLAGGNLPHVARATDFHDKQAGNTMASEEFVSDAI